MRLGWLIGLFTLFGVVVAAPDPPLPAQTERLMIRMLMGLNDRLGFDLGKDEYDASEQATQELVDLGPDILPWLLVMADHPDSVVRHAGVQLMNECGRGDLCPTGPFLDVAARRQVVAALIKRTHDPDTDVRRDACLTLGTYLSEAEPAIDRLIELLADPELGVIVQASGVLGRIGTPARRAGPQLLTALRRHQYEPVVTGLPACLINALGRVGHDDPAIVPLLTEMLADRKYRKYDLILPVTLQTLPKYLPLPAETVAAVRALEAPVGSQFRTDVLAVLAATGDGDAVTELQAITAGMHKETGSMRESAISALGQFGRANPATQPLLTRLLDDPDKTVAAAARQALGLPAGP